MREFKLDPSLVHFPDLDSPELQPIFRYVFPLRSDKNATHVRK